MEFGRRTFVQLFSQTLSYNASSKTSYFLILFNEKVVSKERWNEIWMYADAHSKELAKIDKLDHQSYEMCDESPLSPLQLVRIIEVEFFTSHIKNRPVMMSRSYFKKFGVDCML